MKITARFENFPPYVPIEPFEVLSEKLGLPPSSIIKLDANENPYGPSPKAQRALAELAFAHIYPDPESRDLRKALSRFTEVPAEYLIPGSGADELIDLLLRVMLEPGDIVLDLPPTFGMYSFDTALNSGQIIDVPRRPDFSIDVESVEQLCDQHRAKILFITSPNNPDGSITPPDVLERLLNLPVLVVLDEAYIEFSDQGGFLGDQNSRIKEVPDRENLVILRTFSKWAGLAGLRIGYGAFPKWLLAALWKAKQPYNVSVAASKAAIASLDDLNYLASNVARLRSERTRLMDKLNAVPYLQTFPSQANFILCKVIDRPAEELKAQLINQGIFIRHYKTPQLNDFIRISVGRPQDTDAIIQVLSGKPRSDLIAPSIENRSITNRSSTVQRETKETKINLSLNLDGQGKYHIRTELPFLDHMLIQIAVHGLFDLNLTASGDIEIDPHHTVEDIGLTLGQAFREAVGDRRGITRMASADCPMDESLAHVVVDFSGRPYCIFQCDWHAPTLGGIPVSLFAHFFESFAYQAACNLHINVPYGKDDHHQAEAIFKAFARALAASIHIDPRRVDKIPSSKGIIF